MATTPRNTATRAAVRRRPAAADKTETAAAPAAAESVVSPAESQPEAAAPAPASRASAPAPAAAPSIKTSTSGQRKKVSLALQGGGAHGDEDGELGDEVAVLRKEALQQGHEAGGSAQRDRWSSVALNYGLRKPDSAPGEENSTPRRHLYRRTTENQSTGARDPRPFFCARRAPARHAETH
jgi:hypothetical protein